MFIGDILLLHVTINKIKIGDQRISESAGVLDLQFTMFELRRLLKTYSIEQLTVFRSMFFDEFNTQCSVATTDVWAMYAYQCGMYEECVQFCRQVS
jgi:hypothetical protein